MIARAPIVLAVHPSVPARTVKARAIAVSSAKPTPLIPGLPAIAESGVPGFTYENWWGLFAPAGTPGAVVNTINAAVNKALVNPGMKQLFDREGAQAAPMSVAELADLLPKEIARYRKAAQTAGITPQ